jgi:hypothetical protein
MFAGKGKSWLIVGILSLIVSCLASSILEQKLWMLMQRLSLLQSFSNWGVLADSSWTIFGMKRMGKTQSRYRNQRCIY